MCQALNQAREDSGRTGRQGILDQSGPVSPGRTVAAPTDPRLTDKLAPELTVADRGRRRARVGRRARRLG